MGHNKDRRPTYPAENKKGKGKSFVKLLKDGWAFALLVIYFVFCIINFIVIVHDNHTRRNQIKDNPVETEAVITRIGKKEFWRGRHAGIPVYYDYYVGDSLYHGKIYTRSKKERDTNNMRVGNTIKITYERDNPSNSMFKETISQY